jgi:tRNA A-37 threonylcarbamoyl transferase component Bud32
MLDAHRTRRAIGSMADVRIRLRSTDERLLSLPWERALSDWDPALFLPLEVGPSRNVVRFVEGVEGRYALKELDAGWAEREWRVLRRCADAGVPAVAAIGLVEREGRPSIVITRALAGVDSYRRLLADGSSIARLDDLLDALVLLLVELHRAGIYWGDATLANTLLSRDGDGLVALLVDGETGEVHPDGLSDGQRRQDVDLCVERVAHGLADLAIARGEPDDGGAIAAAERIATRYAALWSALTEETTIEAGDMHAVARRVRHIEALGFTVREIRLRPAGEGVTLAVATGRRRALGEHLERISGVRALEGQARLLLDDLALHRVWLSSLRGHEVEEAETARHWRAERLEPTLARLASALAPGADALQAYCEVLEEKWLASESAGRDVGLQAALERWLDARR